MNVGIITFSDRVVKQFDLKEFKRKSKIRSAVKKINQSGGIYTHTADAIRFMRTDMFNKKAGHRPEVFKIGIVITDGKSTNTTATAIEAKLAREEGIHMFAIGVGRNYDINELYDIASEPSQDYVFRARNYRTLNRLKNLLAVKACSGNLIQYTICTSTLHPLLVKTSTSKICFLFTNSCQWQLVKFGNI